MVWWTKWEIKLSTNFGNIHVDALSRWPRVVEQGSIVVLFLHHFSVRIMLIFILILIIVEVVHIVVLSFISLVRVLSGSFQRWVWSGLLPVRGLILVAIVSSVVTIILAVLDILLLIRIIIVVRRFILDLDSVGINILKGNLLQECSWNGRLRLTKRKFKIQIQQNHVPCWISGPLNFTVDDDLLGVNVVPLFCARWVFILIIRNGL